MGLISNSFYTTPTHDEIEITLIGSGGGYGECIVAKINSLDWIIIDSCQNPTTKVPIALDYLDKIGVDSANQVKFVICTHWHDDHIRGISKILDKCKNARFCMPAVNDTSKFCLLVGLDSEKAKVGSISSFKEFSECLTILSKRENNSARRMSADLLLYSEKFQLSNGNNINSELYSLSPSDSVIQHFDKEISKLMDEFKISKKTVVEKSANEKSSVLLFKYGEFSILLGADLEIGKNKNEGWNDILNNSNIVKTKSFLYKVPHHASKNSYKTNIYNKLIQSDAILKISPWNKRNKLPEVEMLNTYYKHSKNVYLTSSNISSNKPKKRDKSINKMIEFFSRNISEIKYSEGFIRTRHSLIDLKEIKIETFGSALKIK